MSKLLLNKCKSEMKSEDIEQISKEEDPLSIEQTDDIKYQNKNDDFYRETILPLISGDDTNAVYWLRSKRLIPDNMKCEGCNQSMNWSLCENGFVWNCMFVECSNYKKRKSIQTGSFFEQSRITFQQWIHIFYLWSCNESVKRTSSLVGKSMPAMIRAFSLLREICARYLQCNPITLGGPGKVIEINNSCFSNKPRHNCVSAPHSDIWVFGIAEADSDSSIGYMERVNRTDIETIFPIIKKRVNAGSTIHSDKCHLYYQIQQSGLEQRTVHCAINFVESNEAHNEHINSYINRQKNRIKILKGCRKDSLDSYLSEFMWRDLFKEGTFEKICEHVSLFHNKLN